MKFLFDILLYQPIFNLFTFIYNLIPDAGIAIILLTILIKLVLHPLSAKSVKAQKSLQDLQPKIEEIKKANKGNQQAIAQETMKLYKDNNVNPFGSCLPILIQLPIFLALYYALRTALSTDDFSLLYPFVTNPIAINPITLGRIDLSVPNVVLAVLAGAAQFWQAKSMSTKRPPASAGAGSADEDTLAIMNKQMLYFMPLLTVIIGLSFPGGLALYWLVSTLFTAIHQVVVFRKKDTPDDGVLKGEIVE